MPPAKLARVARGIKSAATLLASSKGARPGQNYCQIDLGIPEGPEDFPTPDPILPFRLLHMLTPLAMCHLSAAAKQNLSPGPTWTSGSARATATISPNFA
jgi:hypothetical protein